MTSLARRSALFAALAIAFAGRAYADAASADSTSRPDSAAASATAEPDSSIAAAPPAPSVPPYVPSPSLEALSHFRLDRSADVETVLFGDRSDAIEPAGLASLAAHLRLSPGIRTRELSQGPTAETFDVGGTGSGRSALLLRGAPIDVPGTAGPQSHEVVLSEIDGFSVVRGGAAALYGPSAVDGAVVLLPRQPLPDSLTCRATAEEGVDDWQRGAFHVARRLGSSGGFFAETESRRLDGFFPGTKEVDRHVAGTVVGLLPFHLEGQLGFRRFDGDGRHGGTDPGVIRSVLSRRDDLRGKVFRATREGGVLVEAGFLREKLETGVGGSSPLTRHFHAPSLRVTADLPSALGIEWIGRVEGERFKVDRIEAKTVEAFARAAAALRATRRAGGSFVTATGRLDAEEARPALLQARLEGEWQRGSVALFAVASRGERVPDREATDPDVEEAQTSGEAGARVGVGVFVFRGVLFATNVDDLRREPTLEELRARSAVTDAPLGDAEIRGATVGFVSERFPMPGLRPLGNWQLRSSVTRLSAELATGARLPGRPRLSWTGEGFVERRFFKDELLARLRGRLTHEGDRVDTAGEPVVDAWVTDVLLEGEVGDAVFFYRFHDLLERADEIEPGFRLPGFSRMWGVTWRFVG